MRIANIAFKSEPRADLQKEPRLGTLPELKNTGSIAQKTMPCKKTIKNRVFCLNLKMQGPSWCQLFFVLRFTTTDLQKTRTAKLQQGLFE
jgi:hypothetical protein